MTFFRVIVDDGYAFLAASRRMLRTKSARRLTTVRREIPRTAATSPCGLINETCCAAGFDNAATGEIKSNAAARGRKDNADAETAFISPALALSQGQANLNLSDQPAPATDREL